MMDNAKNPKFWKAIRENEEYKVFMDTVWKNYRNLCNKTNHSHKFSDFIKFKRDGSRLDYEKNYFNLRNKLHTLLILSLIYPEEEKYISELEDVIWNICDEFTWIIPAHSDDDVTVDALSHKIDLFAALTGTAFAIVKNLVGHRLDALVVERMEKEVEERIINAFINTRSWWEGVTNNWAAVCGGNTAITFMTFAPQKYLEQKSRFDKIIDNFLSGYGDDGICTEGITYWNFGFGNFVFYAQNLLEFTDGRENLFKSEKVRQIARFCEAATLNNTTISFSDGRKNGYYAVSVMHLLKSIYKDEINLPSPERIDIYGSTRTPEYLTYAFIYYNPQYKNNRGNISTSRFYPDAQWYVKKMPEYAFAVKAGHNNEHHNHNDVGGFILEVDSYHIVSDLGAGLYTKEYFHGDHMYDIFCKSSLGHSVPIINGKVQGAGEEFSGKMTMDGDRVIIRMEDAYPAEELKSLERSFEFDEHNIKMCDRFEMENDDDEIIERIITGIEPRVEDNCIVLGNVELVSDREFDITKTEHINHESFICNVYCIDYKLNGSGEFTLNLSVNKESEE